MAEFPALPLFTDAYLADTRHLTTLQHGAYFLMLMTAWRSRDCSLPCDDTYLARITGMDRRTWKGNKAILMAFWAVHTSEDGQQFCTQSRLKDERNYVENMRNNNVRAGRASALKRLNRGSTHVPTNPPTNQATDGQQHVNKTSTPTPTPIREERKEPPSEVTKESQPPPKPDPRGTRVPDDFEPDQSCIDKAEELRFTIEQSQRSYDTFMNYWKAKAGKDARKVDWQATFRNWMIKDNENRSLSNGKTTSNRRNNDAIVRAVINEAERREAQESQQRKDETIVELSRLRKGFA